MAPITITQNELVEALAKASVAPTEARTVTELVKLTGWPVVRVRNAIGKLAMQDRIELHQVIRTGISGISKRVPAYTITPPKRK
jgi:hypothetical protein